MRIRNVLISLSTALLLCSCSRKDILPQEARTTTYKVAVIMPQCIWPSEKPIAQQALQHLEKAQEGLGERVRLELEWIDEDIPHLEEEVRRVTHDAQYAAVIGPKYSRHARMVAKESLALRMPVIMPSVTSAEVQRIYSGSNKTAPNIFFMSESDLSQCQALLTIISGRWGLPSSMSFRAATTPTTTQPPSTAICLSSLRNLRWGNCTSTTIRTKKACGSKSASSTDTLP